MSKTCTKIVEKRGRPRKKESWTAPLLWSRAREYFAKCDNRTKEVVSADGVVQMANPAPYTVQGLCNHLKIGCKTFYYWRTGKSALAEQAQLIHQMITDNRITGALDGVQSSSFAKFLLINDNKEEYRDKVEIENSVSPEAKAILESWVGSWTK